MKTSVRIPGVGKCQVAQVSHGGFLQRGHCGGRQAHLATDRCGHGRVCLVHRQQIERRRRHPQRRQRGKAQPDHGHPREFRMPPTRPWPLDRRKPAPPAALPPRDQQGPGQRQNQQCQCRHRRGIAPGVAKQQRPMEIGQPALDRALVGAANVQTGGRVDDRRPRHIGIKPVSGDLS